MPSVSTSILIPIFRTRRGPRPRYVIKFPQPPLPIPRPRSTHEALPNDMDEL